MKMCLIFITGLIIRIILFTSISAQAQLYAYQAALVPAPPQSVIMNTQNMPAATYSKDVETKVTSYISAKSAKEIIRFYKRSLKDDGWTLLSEIAKGPIAILALGKDNNKVVASITVQDSSDGGSNVYVAVAQELGEGPASDAYAIGSVGEAPGKDPNWAPAYPGAIRRMYNEDKQTGQVTVVYAANDSVEQVVKFYSERMPNSGWWLKDKVSLEKIAGLGKGNYQNLVFEGWQGNCVVSVNKPDNLSKFGQVNENITAILLTFKPKI